METKPTKEDIEMGLMLVEAQRFWEGKRRFKFNIAVGISGVVGLIPLLMFMPFYLAFFIPGILFYGFVANTCYSLGYVLDSYTITNSNGSKSLKQNRQLLYLTGVVLSCIITFFGSLVFGLLAWD
jgi:hypothetical protein